MISVFSDGSFDNYEYARCNKQVIKPRFQDKGAMALKYKSTPTKFELGLTHISILHCRLIL